jgi:hypothetical protein
MFTYWERFLLCFIIHFFIPHIFFNHSFKRMKKYDWGSTRLHSVENSLWKRLWTCHKTDYLINVCMNEWIIGFFFFLISHIKELSMFIMWISDETNSFCGDIQIVQNLNWLWIYLFCVGFSTCCICSYYVKMLIWVRKVLKIFNISWGVLDMIAQLVCKLGIVTITWSC